MKHSASKPILMAGTTDSFPSIEYASGFRAPDPVVLLKSGAEIFLIVPQMEFGRASRTERAVSVFTPETLGLEGAARGKLGEWALRMLRKLGIKAVTVPVLFPHGVAKYLEEHGIRVLVAAHDLFPERAVKSPDELRKIRESQQAAVIAMRAAIAHINAAEIDNSGSLRFRGKIVSSESVREIISRILFEHNCMPKDVIVAGGAQAADPHEAGSGPLHAGETIVIDIFPRNMTHGYWGDLTRTVVKGNASPFIKRIYHAVKAAQLVALSRVKAGVNGATVHRSVVDEFRRRKLLGNPYDDRSTGFIHSTGHGVGLSIHEAPSVSTAEGRLKAGNVITIEPGLYYPGIGGVRIEDTIFVTHTGWRYLVPCEKKFEV